MDGFCDTPFWSTAEVWDGSWPQFTDCFQDTLLIWVPCGWLALASPVYLYSMLAYYTRQPLRYSKIFVSKMVLCTLFFGVTVAQLVYRILDHKDENRLKATIFAPGTLAVALLLSSFLATLEHQRGFITSGVQFLFWLLLCLTQIVPFYTKIELQEYDSSVAEFVLFYVRYGLILLIFIVHCFAEKPRRPFQTDKMPCPETEASFLSRLTFWWGNGLLLQGYRTPLTEEMMMDLNPREKSSNVVPTFLKSWAAELGRARARMAAQRLGGRRRSSADLIDDAEQDQNNDTATLIASENPRRRRGGGKEKGPKEVRKVKSPLLSLLKVLFKTFGGQLFLSQIWKVFYDALILSNPLVLGWLVQFIEDRTSPMWKGYLFAVMLFLSMQLQSVFFHQLFHLSTSLGLRLRTSLISTIFRKSLTMTNQARRASTVGEVVNLMSVDTEHVESMLSYLWALWSSPLQICVALYLLFRTLGLPMLAGMGIMVLMIPVNGLVMAKMGSLMNTVLKEKDQRMKLLNEVLSGMKILKLYAWEQSFSKQISDVRNKELRCLWDLNLWQAAMIICWTLTPYLVSLVTFLTYIYTSEEHYLRPDVAFVAIGLFNVLRFAVSFAPMVISELIECVISLRRIGRYLCHDDLDLDSIVHDSQAGSAVCIRNGTFKWNETAGPALKNVSVEIPEGSLVAVVGKVGAGKSSLISAIIGDMEKTDGLVAVKGSVAYGPQQAWIQNDTVRNNILFGQPMREDVYSDCLSACALEHDLGVLAAGDLTEIGERGINLSGGQKQRVSVARAVYSDADVYLLDDPLSAVDTHVGKHIFERVIGRDGLLKHKTRVLVTHGVHWLPLVDKIMVMKSGVVSEEGSYEELLSHNGPFARFLKTYLLQHEKIAGEEDTEVQEMCRKVRERVNSLTTEEEVEEEEEEEANEDKGATSSSVDPAAEDGALAAKETKEGKDGEKPASGDTLIEEEKVETGRVKLAVFKEYAVSVGYIYFFLIFGLYIMYQVASVLDSIWLSKWTDDGDLANFTLYPANSSQREDRNNEYIAIYGGLGAAQTLFVLVYSIMQSLRSVHASRLLHQKMLTRLFHAPMVFFDTTPTGRVVNRFAQDIATIDTELPMTLFMGLDSACIVFSTLIIISYSTPYFLVAVLPLFFMYAVVQQFYIPTSRQLKRLESKTRSPIYNYFNETIAGASIIRAFGKVPSFIEESERRVDANQIFHFSTYTANRWLGFRLEFLGNVVVLLASCVAVAMRSSLSGGIVGLSVSYALQITENLNWVVRMMSDLETQIVSVERVKEYTELISEAPWENPDHRPASSWPQRGEISVTDLCLRYRPELDLVVRNVSFAIQSGQKIGVVGRTGAGKSSLMLALFRLIEADQGTIHLDDVNIADLGLHDLRTKLTILPQDPVVFAGTLRTNIDPFDNYSDEQVWQALEHAHLKTYVESLSDSLQHECGQGGENLSVGQRQLVCLARSLLHKTKVLILDEATAAVDMETDDLIQKTIREKFTDCTVLTIAHRLNTILDYDKVLVMDKGEVAEFDTVSNLLENKDSIFFQMAQTAGLAS